MTTKQNNGGSAPRRKRKTENKQVTKKTARKAPAKKQSPSSRGEIRGVIVIVLGIATLWMLFSSGSSIVEERVRDFYGQLFGQVSVLIGMAIVALGIRMLWVEKPIRPTIKGTQYFTIAMAIILAYLMIMVETGHEFDAEYVVYGGAIFNGILKALRATIGNLGTIFLILLTLVLNGIAFGLFSVRRGFEKAGGAASEIGTKAKEKAEEQIVAAKEHIEEWQEQRRIEKEKNTVYNQEKDPKYPTKFEEIIEEGRQRLAEIDTSVEEEVPSFDKEDPRAFVEDIPEKCEAWSEEDRPIVHTYTMDEDITPIEVEEYETPSVQNNYEVVEDEFVPAIEDTEEIPLVDISYMDDEEELTPPWSRHYEIPTVEIEPMDSYDEPEVAVEEPVEELEFAHVDVEEPFVEETSYEEPVEERSNPFVAEPAPKAVQQEERQNPFANPQMVAPNPAVMMGHKSHKEAAKDAAHALTAPNILAKLDPTAAYEGAASEVAAVSVSKDEKEVPMKVEIPYQYPPLSLLAPGKEMEDIDEEVEEKARLLEETLQSFKVDARIINATKGPAVTRYELEPARGVKVNKIVSLTDDIALNLAAADIRMEAPIPGKAAIGIEIPNSTISAVNLRDVLDCEEFLQAKGGIPVGLGKDIAGQSVITDLSKMPHLLVAGSTGSGKSVCINTLISSILFHRKPDEVKLILIDPKMVELSNYNGVPHLMMPVVTDMKKATTVLRWAVREMESRYRTFADRNVRDVKRYNELYPESHMPLIVIIIDELADLMMVSPVDIEDSICRLAQMARAAGIHLVLATQRPSVDVITGTIKANVPSRISFAVSSQIDSRTILDMAGAEKLLGKGDMLFNPIGASKPVRIQGAFISDDEVEALVDFIKRRSGPPKYDDSILALPEESVAGDDGFDEDELLPDAIKLIIESGTASTSMLQRKLRIGFTRAGRIMDTLETMGVVGPNLGSKARDIIMSPAEIDEKIFNRGQE